MDDRTASRDELLRVAVAADAALRPDRESFRVTRLESHLGPQVLHSGFRKIGQPNDWIECARQDIEELNDLGLIRLKKKTVRVSGRRGAPAPVFEEWRFDVTDQGFQHVDRTQRLADHGRPTTGGGLDWKTDVLPVLVAAYSTSAGSDPALGVLADAVNERMGRERNDPDTGRVLVSLVDVGWIIPVIDGVNQVPGPYSFRLSERALQEVAGWPTAGSGDRFVEQLLAVLDEEIAGAQGERKSGLVRLRETIVGVGHDVLVGVLVDAARRYGGIP
jgi:hypothetical protein